MEFTTQQIAFLIGGEIHGDGDLKIKKLEKIQDATAGGIAFLDNLKYESHLYTTKASAVILHKDFVPKEPVTTTLIKVADPRACFSGLLEEFHKIVSFIKKGIEQPCFIAESSTIGEQEYRGAFSYIGENCIIGNNVKIYPQAYIGDNVVIGNNTIIYSGVKIYAGTEIGNFCTIHSGTVIGSDGFGFAPLPDGSYKTIPQVGNVIIEDHVDIGANSVIDCATMGSTIIRQGVKLDNLIQIAHNAEIGKHTVIASQSGVSGSTKIGEYCLIGGQVGFVGHISIASRTSIGAQAGISKSITKEGSSIAGTPAFDYKSNLKSFAIYKKLPEVQRKIEELQKQLKDLANQS